MTTCYARSQDLLWYFKLLIVSTSPPVLTSSRNIAFVGLPTDHAAETFVLLPRFIFVFYRSARFDIRTYGGGCIVILAS
jgi:hypothetical protein